MDRKLDEVERVTTFVSDLDEGSAIFELDDGADGAEGHRPLLVVSSTASSSWGRSLLEALRDVDVGSGEPGRLNLSLHDPCSNDLMARAIESLNEYRDLVENAISPYLNVANRHRSDGFLDPVP